MSVHYGSRRVTTGAHYGLRDWMMQRATAAIITVFTLVLLLAVVLSPGPLDYYSWSALFAPQWMKFLSLIAIVSVCWHAWVGVRDIWMDYIKRVWLRFALHVLTIAWLVGCAGWAVQVLWRV